ncbi:hypothetical protein AB1L88_07730 [Tautonia sp. JC769]|uniref:hypothetical protein n=1 Tax=Tautonia sp. JC769 TaxID=3232135 RepID=UPI003459501C
MDPDAAVWSASAAALIDAHWSNPNLPLDPELFVIAQPQCPSIADPWGDLVGPLAVRRYRRRVARIVRRLRAELRAELRLVRARGARGIAVESQLAKGGRGLSPLGRYVAAIRLGRPDLAASLRDDALRQHDGCPLYQLACRGLVPDDHYPATIDTPSPLAPLPVGAFVGWN